MLRSSSVYNGLRSKVFSNCIVLISKASSKHLAWSPHLVKCPSLCLLLMSLQAARLAWGASEAKEQLAMALALSAELPEGLSAFMHQLCGLFDAFDVVKLVGDTAASKQQQQQQVEEAGSSKEKQLPSSQPHVMNWIYKSLAEATRQYEETMQAHADVAGCNTNGIGFSGTSSSSCGSSSDYKPGSSRSRGHPLLLWLDVVLRALMLRLHCQAIR